MPTWGPEVLETFLLLTKPEFFEVPVFLTHSRVHPKNWQRQRLILVAVLARLEMYQLVSFSLCKAYVFRHLSMFGLKGIDPFKPTKVAKPLAGDLKPAKSQCLLERNDFIPSEFERLLTDHGPVDHVPCRFASKGFVFSNLGRM